MDLNYAQYLMQKIKEDYDKIAKDFSQKRSYIPQDFLYLKQFIKKGDKILDLGCGNGRLYQIKNDAQYFGVDVSEKMIEIARQKYPQGRFFITNGLALPFEDNFFDTVFCLSVFHHIPSKEYRLKFLKEIHRVLKPGGLLILTVWNLLPKRRIKHLLFKYTLLKLIGKSKLDFFDIILSWKNSKGKIMVNRYIHVFRKGELRKLSKKAGFQVKKINILARSKKESNIFVLAKKV